MSKLPGSLSALPGENKLQQARVLSALPPPLNSTSLSQTDRRGQGREGGAELERGKKETDTEKKKQRESILVLC